MGREYDLIIGGKRVKTTDKIKSAESGEAVANSRHSPEGRQGAREPAMNAALKAFETWSRTTVEERAALLFRVAETIRERKFEFCAWLVFEVGKNWAEADADIAETIDFLRVLRARSAAAVEGADTDSTPGEHDMLRYIPLGVGAVIPPWNFPFAIMAGMTLASIVCGNTVILKPSSDSPTIAAKFVEVLEEARHARRRRELLPGRAAATFGDALVEHPKTRFIAFTGSREVGLHINERAADTRRRTDLDQAHHPRDGRQGRDHRRCRCRYRRRRRRRRRSGVRIPGTEVLGLLARNHR